jgi:hypothetical protein
MTFKGPWDKAADYVSTDVVAYNAQTWFAIAPNITSSLTQISLTVPLAGIVNKGPR